ncbi:MAG: FG-GAP repeat protein [Planctomycetota bacterium]|nr:FG-GAP repeat protein [Planctomycetota bacterium]
MKNTSVMSRFKLALIAMTIFCGTTVSGQIERAALFAADGVVSDRYGSSVAVSGDVVVVGAYLDDELGGASGLAYVYARHEGGLDNWGLVTKLTASDGVANDWFGAAVAIDGDIVVVGAKLDDDNGDSSGSVYVYARDEGGPDNWGEVTKLIASDGAIDEQFGDALSISGDLLLVGAHLDDDNGFFSGSAYVFARNLGGPDNWGEVTKILPSDGDSSDQFGDAVSIDGDIAIVGAGIDEDNGEGAGAVYIFAKDLGGPDNWGEVTKLLAPDGMLADKFGASVALSGDILMVGALKGDGVVVDSGSAYLFDRNKGGSNNWGIVTEIFASDAALDDWFGLHVSLDGSNAIVSAIFSDGIVADSGSAYVFARNQGGNDNWGETAKLTASNGALDDEFGRAVAIDGDAAIVGAFTGDGIVADTGSAYLYDGVALGWLQGDCNGNGESDLLDVIAASSPDCNCNYIPDECDIASGFSLDLNFDGVPDECLPICPADITGPGGVPDGVVDVEDLLVLLAAWGACP